jgi:hypothetical protein
LENLINRLFIERYEPVFNAISRCPDGPKDKNDERKMISAKEDSFLLAFAQKVI